MTFSQFVTRSAFLVGAVSLLQGCGGAGEDPRITLCKAIAADFSGINVSQWHSAGEEFVRPEYVRVKVNSADAGNASCNYAHEAYEESAVEHAQPLLAYATLPYSMQFNGVEVAEETLRAAVLVQQREAPAEALRQAREALDKARDSFQQAMSKQGF